MAHPSFGPEVRPVFGISDSLVRVSVGIKER